MEGVGRAVSLVELLLAVSLISLVLLSAAALYTASSGYFSAFNAQAEMQNQANFALQHMISHIYQADDVEILEPNRLRVFIETAGQLPYEEYWRDDSCSCLKYKYVDNGEGNEKIIATKIEELIFSDYNRDQNSQRITLKITLKMKRSESWKLKPLTYTTSVTLRRYE